MDNQQDYILNSKQVQVIVSGILGDGHIVPTSSDNYYYQTSCIHKEYLEKKAILLGNLSIGSIKTVENNGYKKGTIYTLSTKYSKNITDIGRLSIGEQLSLLDDMGIAMWFYDDGSLHKRCQFYNLNTHAFSQEINEDVFKPYFKDRWGMNPKVLKEEKKDGRVFYYLYFGRHFGAFNITIILRKYYIKCFEYKMWSSETIQKWSKLLVQLKSENKTITPRKFGDLMLQ